MNWPAVASILSVLATIILGVLTFVRGSKADEALNTATTVQSTFDAQRYLFDNLQEEMIRTKGELDEHRQLLRACEDDCRRCRSNLAGSRLIIQAQEVEIENLKAVMAEHELTISRHEATINKMSRRSDRPSEPRPDGQERRKEP